MSCSGCSRRDFFQLVGGAIGVSLLASACAPQAPSTGKASTCAQGLCVDLTDPANAALTKDGGSIYLDTPSDQILVLRQSASSYLALSAVCPHQGCSVEPSGGELVCPCHGATFGMDGRVQSGPTNENLQVYRATLSSNLLMIAA